MRSSYDECIARDAPEKICYIASIGFSLSQLRELSDSPGMLGGCLDQSNGLS